MQPFIWKGPRTKPFICSSPGHTVPGTASCPLLFLPTQSRLVPRSDSCAQPWLWCQALLAQRTFARLNAGSVGVTGNPRFSVTSLLAQLQLEQWRIFSWLQFTDLTSGIRVARSTRKSRTRKKAHTKET